MCSKYYFMNARIEQIQFILYSFVFRYNLWGLLYGDKGYLSTNNADLQKRKISVACCAGRGI